jgi:hypothetical protein
VNRKRTYEFDKLLTKILHTLEEDEASEEEIGTPSARQILTEKLELANIGITNILGQLLDLIASKAIKNHVAQFLLRHSPNPQTPSIVSNDNSRSSPEV